MTDQFEQALRRALQSQDPGEKNPGEHFASRIVAQIHSGDCGDAEDAASVAAASVTRLESRRFRGIRSAWLPAALAAGIIVAVGFIQMRQHALDAARANQARAQLLQALSIASDNVNIVRTAVAREENPDS